MLQGFIESMFVKNLQGCLACKKSLWDWFLFKRWGIWSFPKFIIELWKWQSQEVNTDSLPPNPHALGQKANQLSNLQLFNEIHSKEFKVMWRVFISKEDDLLLELHQGSLPRYYHSCLGFLFLVNHPQSLNLIQLFLQEFFWKNEK